MKLSTKNLLTTLPTIALSITILASCTKNKDIATQPGSMYTMNSDRPLDSNFVDMEMAQLIAERLTQDHFQNESDAFLTGDGREITSSFPLRTDPDLPPTAYVFNYADGEGYTIISADYRYEPILAFGASGSLNQGDSIPAGMYEWMMSNLENIDLIRDGSLNDKEKFKAAYSTWSYTINHMQLKDCCIHPEDWTPTPSPCVNWDNQTNEVVGPLTQTKWGQGHRFALLPQNDFNYLVNSPISCSGNRPLAGCVSIATAQILKYWSKPHPNYNYSMMYNVNATNESQRLIGNLGNPAQLDAFYGCTLTSALSSNVSPTLKNTYGFSSGGDFILYVNSERWNIRDNIMNNRIVYVGGANKVTYKSFLIFKSAKYDDVHAWLIDGFRKNNINCYSEFWFHMNWGYYGDFNGWFYESDWAPYTGKNFQYQRTIIKNIYP
ncbi:MAG: C10 family peptidase [Taibaiella sp.]|nr:C10 family peptidase [Taibaiella sp.]